MQTPTIADCVKALTPNELTLDVLSRRLNYEPAKLLPMLQAGASLGYVRCGKSNGQMFWSTGAAPPPEPVAPLPKYVPSVKKYKKRRTKEQIAADLAELQRKRLERDANRTLKKRQRIKPGEPNVITEPPKQENRVAGWPKKQLSGAAKRALSKLRNQHIVVRAHMPALPELSISSTEHGVSIETRMEPNQAPDQQVHILAGDVTALVDALMKVELLGAPR
jgi:hypothetical protein